MNPPIDGAAERKATVLRFFIVHMLAYAVALPWAVAAVPAIFLWKQDTLLALADERTAVVLVVKLAAWPTLAAFVAPHLLGLPWILTRGVGADRDRARTRGKMLFAASSTLLFVAGGAAAVVGWLHVLGA